jgi:hypothetical protein
VLQLNANRSASAMGMLEKNAWDTRTDILLISEPNKKIIEKAQWFKDTRGAAIKVTNRTVKIIREGAGEGFVYAATADTAIYTCYLSPNCTEAEFEIFLRKLGIVAGDFNSHSPAWGSTKEDKRGRVLLEWISQNQLVVHNEGSQPPYRRGDRMLHVDLTLTTEDMANELENWKVDASVENLSDHDNILFEIRSDAGYEKGKGKREEIGWQYDPNCEQKFGEALERNIKGNGVGQNAADWQRAIIATCDEVLQRKRRDPYGRRPVWWWCKAVAEERRSEKREHKDQQKVAHDSNAKRKCL